MIRSYKYCVYVLIILITIETLYISLYDLNHSSNINQDLECDVTGNEYSKPVYTSREGPYFLYILIFSAPRNWLQRLAIRNTWAKTASKYHSVKYSFLIGNIEVSKQYMSAVQKEKAKYGDISILYGVEEKYTLLSKKVLKGFVWAGKHIDAVYYLKTDDDSYVIIENLFKALTTENIPTKKLVMGYMNSFSHIITEGKWSESGWFLCPSYFPYPAGAGYIITQDVVTFLTINSERLMHYNNEDTSLGSWVAPLDLHYFHDVRVLQWRWHKSCARTSWLRHYVSPKSMKKMHSAWFKTKDTCDKDLNIL